MVLTASDTLSEPISYYRSTRLTTSETILPHERSFEAPTNHYGLFMVPHYQPYLFSKGERRVDPGRGTCSKEPKRCPSGRAKQASEVRDFSLIPAVSQTLCQILEQPLTYLELYLGPCLWLFKPIWSYDRKYMHCRSPGRHTSLSTQRA